MKTDDLLVEIGTEELPPKALKKLSYAFAEQIKQGLEEAALDFGAIKPYATPRRLAVLVSDLVVQQEDKIVERRGPALRAAFDEEGRPTRAATGFASSCGVDVSDLEQMETDKGSWLVFRMNEPGKLVEELIPDIVSNALDRLPIPKRMRWGQGDATFVRPVHWIVLLYGNQVIDAEILGIQSGNQTCGHRFHAPYNIEIRCPDDYEQVLKAGMVIAGFDQRSEIIREQAEASAREIGGSAVIDPALLEEVTGMVEWPVTVAGGFDEDFLELPDEVLISTMARHQKYFHVVSADGKLMPYFIAVSNIESRNPAVVRHGNERVIRPRLSDSAHFWKTDLATDFSVWQKDLEKVIFQEKLGSIADKSRRIARLASLIAERLDGNKDWAERAGLICKCDLMSEMVGEFPDLQGIMGRYYAEDKNEPAEVALAMEEQYMPRFAGDQIPQTVTGRALAIADRLDTLTGIFGIGQPPSGMKDPFALRRAALGCLRTMVEGKLDLALRELLSAAVQEHADNLVESDVEEQVFNYMMERLRGYYLEQGVPADVYDAVLSRNLDNPYDFDRRIHAVHAFRQRPEAESLAAANKRIRNILKNLEGHPPEELERSLLQEKAEQDLFDTMQQIRERITDKLISRDYTAALADLAKLREPVDSFFDQVMVMCDDVAVRNNRLALLNQLRSLFMEIADISRLQS